jgi:RNA polymerase sigma-70 factor, ECF subfamily
MLTTSPTLLERLRQPSDGQAWRRFVDLYAPLILYWANRQGFQDADAEDLAQQVLIKLLGLLPTYERGNAQSFRGWLSTVCRHLCHDYRRRRATRPMPGADGLSAIKDSVVPSEIEERDHSLFLVHRVLELIRRDFSDQTWAAFTEVMIKGRDVEVVASELGMTVNAVYMARHRVLTRLRRELDGLLD